MLHPKGKNKGDISRARPLCPHNFPVWQARIFVPPFELYRRQFPPNAAAERRAKTARGCRARETGGSNGSVAATGRLTTWRDCGEA